jgi:hypothetical protein
MTSMKREDFCPLIKGECRGINCNFYIQLMGRHPSTGQPVDEWGCTFTWLPFLLIENSKEVRQGAAATESFRNIMFRLAAGESPDQIQNGEMRLLDGGS